MRDWKVDRTTAFDLDEHFQDTLEDNQLFHRKNNYIKDLFVPKVQQFNFRVHNYLLNL